MTLCNKSDKTLIDVHVGNKFLLTFPNVKMLPFYYVWHRDIFFFVFLMFTLFTSCTCNREKRFVIINKQLIIIVVKKQVF